MANQEPKGKHIDWEKVARLFLHTIPILPGREIYDLLKDLQTSRTELGEKVTRVATALENASKLVAELEAELATKVEQVDRLKTEYERYQQLATLEEGKAKALIEQLQLIIGAGRPRERWIALVINIVADIIVFILGVWLSPWIKTLFGIGI